MTKLHFRTVESSAPLPKKVWTPIPFLIPSAAVAARVGISPVTLTEMVAEGRGPRAVRVGTKKIMFDPVDVNLWIEQQKSA